MAESPAKSLALLDSAPLTPRYWGLFGAASFAAILEFFDVFIVGFLVSVIGPVWQLTFMQIGIILLAAGIGSIFGGGLGGGLADRFGRKPVLIGASLVTALASTALGLIPDGQWLGFAVLRFFVGIGQGGLAAAMLPLLVEWTPVRRRTLLTTLQSVATTVGILLASLIAASLLSRIGWRGVAFLGVAPLLSAALIVLLVPESPRWLLSRGRSMEAQAAAQRVFGVDLGVQDLGAPPPRARFVELFAYRRQVLLIVISWICFSTVQNGVLSWGPTLLAQTLSVSPAEAAGMFVAVSLAGIVGTLAFAVIANGIGRSLSCRLAFYGIAVLIACAAFAGGRLIMGVSLFLICIAAAEFLLAGVVANLSPYSAELWAARLAGSGMGLAQIANGVGKIVGPASLALIAGSNDYITPKATVDAIVPAFVFLALLSLLAAITFTVIRIETHRRSIALAGTA